MKFPKLRFRLKSSILLASAFATAIAAAQGFRVWEDANGRKVEAEFRGMDGDNVNLALKSGKVLPFPIAKLSAADREWLKTAKQPAPAPASASATAATEELVIPEHIQIILEDTCQDCHEDGTEKGDVRLD